MYLEIFPACLTNLEKGSGPERRADRLQLAQEKLNQSKTN